MSVAIIISTHGVAAEQLLITAEMLIGKQENIDYINFFSGENSDKLIEKYKQKLNKLNISQGVLFLVDMWGGTPFNVANSIIKTQKKDKYNIITGVNVPMLVATLLSRDDDPSFSELVNTAIESGRSEIKSLINLHHIDKPKNVSLQDHSHQEVTSKKAGNMLIALARIDDRLIHGQVTTSWTKETKVKRIIVVNDEVAKDHVRSTLLKQVVPPGITAHVIDIEKCIRVYNNPKYAGERVMLLFTNPSDVLRVVKKGVEIKSINIGGMAYREGKIQVNNAISIDDEDIEAFNQLSNHGIELEVRKVSSDKKLDILTIIKKSKTKLSF